MFLPEEIILKRSVQHHAFNQSPPGRYLSDKFPVHTSHCSRLKKKNYSKFYLVVTVIHIQLVRCQICVYMCTHSSHSREAGRAKEMKKIVTTANVTHQADISACRVGHACHRLRVIRVSVETSLLLCLRILYDSEIRRNLEWNRTAFKGDKLKHPLPQIFVNKSRCALEFVGSRAISNSNMNVTAQWSFHVNTYDIKWTSIKSRATIA
jgi:hypothetical protein